MTVNRQRVEDFVRHDLKRAAKRVYQPMLIELARHWRTRLRRTRFIGITGSAGKTTAKDLLHAALSGSRRAVKNDDSNNSLYSVARTVLAARPRTDFCIQEVGLSHEPGRIPKIIELLRPHVGIVTLIGMDHRSAFRSREAIAAEKVQLVASLPSDGIAVLNADDPLVASMARQTAAAVRTFGFGPDAEFRGEVFGARFPERLVLVVRHGAGSTRIQTRLCGRHHAVSVLAAFAAAVSVGVAPEDAAAGLADCEPMLGRMSVQHTPRGVTIIRDDYKAPAWSLAAALQVLKDAGAQRKIAVIGTLSDYSGSSRRTYRRAVRMALGAADRVLVIGDWAPGRVERWADVDQQRLHGFSSVRAASDWLQAFAQPGDLVLLKGSLMADHLARVALSFEREIGCWRRRCPYHVFCDHCRLLGVSSDP